MKIKLLITIIFLLLITAISASASAPTSVALHDIKWSEGKAELRLSLEGLPPTGVSGVFLSLDIEGGVIHTAEVTNEWGDMNTTCEWSSHGLTVMMDSRENILSDKPFLYMVIHSDGGDITVNTRAATGGGVYAYDGDGVRKLLFADGVITLTPPMPAETTAPEETEDTPEEGAPMAHEGTYYVGYQQGIDADNGDAVRFLVLSSGDNGGAVWCTGGKGRIFLSVTTSETVSVYQSGKTDLLPARLPDGTAGIWWIYTFRGLSAGEVYEFCVADGEGITKIAVISGKTAHY